MGEQESPDDSISGSRALWIKGESLAGKFLRKQGYKVLKRNYASKTGEIDIVAYDRGTIVFVEVKARLSEDFGTPELAVTSEKRRRIIKTALHYLMVNNISDIDYRFDIVSIVFTKGKKHPKIELFRGAFTSVGLFDRY